MEILTLAAKAFAVAAAVVGGVLVGPIVAFFLFMVGILVLLVGLYGIACVVDWFETRWSSRRWR